MSTGSAEMSRPTERRIRRAVLIGGILFALLIFGLAYVRIGWDRMASACTDDPPGDPGWASVTFGWSWIPPGFTCTYADGHSETSLWF